MRGSNSLDGPVVRSGGPAYQQISEVLAQEIFRQIWKVGDSLPNEKKLSERFGVSIGTIRRAIESLERSGLISKMQGLGTFVTKQALPTRTYDRATPFKLNDHWATEYVGTEVKTELISLESIQAGHEESRALDIEPGDLIWLIEVRHMLHNQLIAYEQLCLSKKLFPKLSVEMLQKSEGNLYRLASEVFQMRIGQMTDEVSVKSMEPRIANLFNKIPDTPSLRVFRITHSMDNTPIEKREVWLDPSFAHYKATPELT
jgi:GntR family transcriptional regulator